MSFSLEGTGIPGPHMMRENKFPEFSAYIAVEPVIESTEATVLPPREQVYADVDPKPEIVKAE
ncbi:MAG TPA: hypothetical protein PKH60_03800 [Candidatus Woesebacteria bacterium]|nr:hypothetical protein [Candidatus Woesebacteria bacterium]